MLLFANRQINLHIARQEHADLIQPVHLAHDNFAVLVSRPRFAAGQPRHIDVLPVNPQIVRPPANRRVVKRGDFLLVQHPPPGIHVRFAQQVVAAHVADGIADIERHAIIDCFFHAHAVAACLHLRQIARDIR